MSTPDYGPWGLPEFTTAPMGSIVILSDSARAVTPASGAAGETGGTGRMTLTNLATLVGSSGGAPTTATYITQTPNGTLSAEQALSTLSTGMVKVTTTTGVLSTGAVGTDYYAPGGAIAIGDLPTITVAKGGTALTSLPTANQVLGANNGATAYEGKTITAGSNVTVTHGTGTITIASTGGTGSPGGSSGDFQLNNAGSFGGGNLAKGSGGELILASVATPTLSIGGGQVWIDSTRKVISYESCGLAAQTHGVVWQGLSSGTAIGVNSTSQGSVFTGVSTTIGSRVFTANSLTPGKILIPRITGNGAITSGATLNVQILLGSAVIAQGTMTAAATVTTSAFSIEPLNGPGGFQVQVVSGASSKIIGAARAEITGAGSCTMNASGTASGATAQVTFDSTASNTFDIKIQYGSSNAAHGITFLSGWLEVIG